MRKKSTFFCIFYVRPIAGARGSSSWSRRHLMRDDEPGDSKLTGFTLRSSRFICCGRGGRTHRHTMCLQMSLILKLRRSARSVTGGGTSGNLEQTAAPAESARGRDREWRNLLLQIKNGFSVWRFRQIHKLIVCEDLLDCIPGSNNINVLGQRFPKWGAHHLEGAQCHWRGAQIKCMNDTHSVTVTIETYKQTLRRQMHQIDMHWMSERFSRKKGWIYNTVIKVG